MIISVYHNYSRVRFAEVVARNQGIKLPGKLSLTDAAVFLEIFYNKVYAPSFPFYQNAVIVDIGAHKGFFSLFAARYGGGETVTIFAVEPESENFEALVRNIRLNGYDSVVTSRCAVAAKTGKQKFYLSESVNHSLVNAGDTHPHVRQTKEVVVDCFSLADYFTTNGITHATFLKIDCEGSEYDILYNAPDDVLARIETIALEFHDLGHEKNNVYSLLRFLLSKGYRVVRFDFSESLLPLNTGILIVTRGPMPRDCGTASAACSA